MPSTITHSYFAMDVYERLSIKQREFLMDQKNQMKIFGQSMDALFFYNITNFKKGKKVRKFGNFFHKNSSFKFFETLINYIRYNGFKDDPEVMSYLYGMLCHYILDSTCHPYIIYFCGEYEKEKKETLKYNHKHGEWETLIDNYFVQERNHIKPWKFNVIDFCFDLKPFSDNLKEVIDFTYREVFNISNFSQYYEKSLKQMKFFYQVFRRDTLGLKKIGYEIIDFISPKKLLRKKVLSYHLAVTNKKKLLNLGHQKWIHPTNRRKTSTESFLDLYLKAVFEVVHMIQEVDQYIYNEKKVSLKKIIKNRSYVTGLDCDKETELKYFAF